MISKKLLMPSSISKRLIVIPLLAAIAGFLDAVYLSLEAIQNKIPPCTLGGCETVLTSAYAKVFGIPVAAYGVLFYVVFILMAILYLLEPRTIWLRLLFWLVTAGFAVSAWLVFAQVFLIHALCPYCLTSEALITIMFVFLLVIRSKLTKASLASIDM